MQNKCFYFFVLFSLFIITKKGTRSDLDHFIILEKSREAGFKAEVYCCCGFGLSSMALQNLNLSFASYKTDLNKYRDYF